MSQLDTIRAERIEKLAKLRAAGMEPYPTDTRRSHTNEKLLAEHGALESSATTVTIAGRIMSMREHGGSLFLDLFDGTAEVQAYIKKDDFGADAFDQFVALVDAGDIVEISGTAFVTKRGMKSVLASGWRMLAKALLPIPSEWYGIKDEDERYRKRYLDILLSKDLTERIKRRSIFWNSMRSFLLTEGYVEVETPVLETVTGGADARPFITHHNALDIETYLRISAGELWQKKLLVAGLPKVFEIGRIFRNEGMSNEHLQDYTQMESYEAFMDYEQGMEMMKRMYQHVAQTVYGTTKFTIRGFEVDLAGTWERYDYSTLVKKHFNIDPLDTNVAEIEAALKKHGITYDAPTLNIERGVDLLWKQIRKTLGGPGFLIGVPVYLESLAKRSPKDPRVVERFQIILGGSENGKGFSELNDPVDQADRFRHQQALRDGGDDEAQMNDASFVEALEYGMPPAFGFGVSERLFSFLEGVPVREAQIFPLMRPKNDTSE